MDAHGWKRWRWAKGALPVGVTLLFSRRGMAIVVTIRDQ